MSGRRPDAPRTNIHAGLAGQPPLLAWRLRSVLLLSGFPGPDLAAETIALQLLRDAENPQACKDQLRQIMRNIDRLPTEEIRSVRQELGKAIGQLTKQAAERYGQASPDERPELPDADLGKLQPVIALFDVTNQGGMRVRTQADVDRTE